jgi:hypothetical protein
LEPRFHHTHLHTIIIIIIITTTTTFNIMFSCTNYERGCRGRCNAINGRCNACVTLNLQRRPSPSTTSSTGTASPSRTPPNDPGISSSALQRTGADRSFMQLSQNPTKQHR